MDLANQNSTPDRWQPAQEHGHPLGRIQNLAVGGLTFSARLGNKNRFGAFYFQLRVSRKGDGRERPFLLGLFNQGRYPAQNWIEVISLSPEIALRDKNSARFGMLDPLTLKVFGFLVGLLPAGGHIMMEYDSPAMKETARQLAQGVPPAATPAGYMLFMAGCRAGFKDWYFAEGGNEGPRKLQAYKPLNREHYNRKATEMISELEGFIGNIRTGRENTEGLQTRSRARQVLQVLYSKNSLTHKTI